MLLLLLACAGTPTDDTGPVGDVVLAPPAFTPEVGESAQYDAIFTGERPDRVEWTVDGELEYFEDVLDERSVFIHETPAEQFTVGIEAFRGFESERYSLPMEAVPNSAPVVAIVEPVELTAGVGTLVGFAATVDDRTDPRTECVWTLGEAELRRGEPIDGNYNTAWTAVAGTWLVSIECTDKLGLSGSASLTLEVQ